MVFSQPLEPCAHHRVPGGSGDLHPELELHRSRLGKKLAPPLEVASQAVHQAEHLCGNRSESGLCLGFGKRLLAEDDAGVHGLGPEPEQPEQPGQPFHLAPPVARATRMLDRSSERLLHVGAPHVVEVILSHHAPGDCQCLLVSKALELGNRCLFELP